MLFKYFFILIGFVSIVACSQKEQFQSPTLSGKKPICYQCSGAKACLVARSGGKSCNVIADQTGRACIYTLNCGLGQAFGAPFSVYEVPDGDEISEKFETRVNQYLAVNVIPEARECVGKLKESGAVVLSQTYTRDDRQQWQLETAQLVNATVSESTSLNLLNCIKRASFEKSMRPLKEESGQQILTLYWEWPIPFPVN